jgi:protein-tyrosine phosphatase
MMDGPRNDAETMVAAIKAAVDLLAGGERVLVHCSAGECRSVAVAAGVVALRDGVAFPDALERVADAGSGHIHGAVRENAREAVRALRD